MSVNAILGSILGPLERIQKALERIQKALEKIQRALERIQRALERIQRPLCSKMLSWATKVSVCDSVSENAILGNTFESARNVNLRKCYPG